jgi:hypothetical protein
MGQLKTYSLASIAVFALDLTLAGTASAVTGLPEVSLLPGEAYPLKAEGEVREETYFETSSGVLVHRRRREGQARTDHIRLVGPW